YGWDFVEELTEKVDNALTIAAPIRKLRMKVVAHKDYKVAMLEKISLEKVEIKQVDEALSAIGEVLNIIYENINGSEWSWNLISHHDADKLIYHLKIASIYTEQNDDSIEGIAKKNREWLNSKYRDA
ncbi:hypothetical protein ACFLXI_05100, partial [Chloroflexota bacterium]